MSFLAPLFLLGGLAVGLPVAFHLIRRSSREQMPFSSLMFLRPTPPRLTKRSRLEHIILLLLRCLAILLLTLGFARPFFKTPALASLATEPGQKIIVLIDVSASMRREEIWAAALAKATTILNKTTSADQVAVYTFDKTARPVISFAQWQAMNSSERPALATARLNELKPGWGATHLGNALTAGAEAFTEAGKQAQNSGLRRIILITDLQEGSKLEGLQGYEWPRGLEVQVEVVQPKHPTNAGLQPIADGADSTKPAANAGLRVRVSNSANAQREQFQLHWDGVAGAASEDIYVPPGQNRIVRAPKLPAGANGERLVLTGDDDDFDNVVYTVPLKAQETRVLFLGADTEQDSTQPLYYLKRAFQQTASQTVEIKVQRDANAMLATDLADARLVIATDSLADGPATAMRSYVTNGGTLLYLMKNATAAETIGRLAGIEGVNAEEVTATNYALFGKLDFQHPLFAPFSDPHFNDFTKIHFWKYRRLDAARFVNASVLAEFDSGDPALLEVVIGKGRLLILTSGWQPTDSQLAVSSKFVPLLYSMLELSGGNFSPAPQFHIGDEINLDGAVGHGDAPLTVQKPDGTSIPLRAGETKFSQTDMPGIYTIAAGPPSTATAPLASFAVNLDAAESHTAPLAMDELGRLGVPMKAHELELSKQIAGQRHLHDAELEDRQKVWRWLTLAALLVLLGETWLAGWLTRRSSPQTEVAI